EADLGQYNRVIPVFWASGACMLIRADLFRKAGGFDGDFWAHMEEIDLCWRLKNQGYAIACQPESVVFHLGGGTLSYESPKKVYLNFRNNLYMLFKNLPANQFYSILLIRLVLDGVAALKFLAGFSFSSFLAVWRAHLSFYGSLGKLINKRKQLRKQNGGYKHAEVYPGSIMWQFFIRKNRSYSNLNFRMTNETEINI
ncbi:MAG: glycosyltransferase family 2 protein, partial [Mariniphaga sp.]|nr:glycosyltransferase family 2 protein [Mariniphaga sp.]